MYVCVSVLVLDPNTTNYYEYHETSRKSTLNMCEYHKVTKTNITHMIESITTEYCNIPIMKYKLTFDKRTVRDQNMIHISHNNRIYIYNNAQYVLKDTKKWFLETLIDIIHVPGFKESISHLNWFKVFF